MRYCIKIYRSTEKHGSVIDTQLITELYDKEYPYDLDEITQLYEGDFAVVERVENVYV